jgi:hypothetical protein
VEEVRLEGLRAEGDAVDTGAPQLAGELGRDRLGIRLDRQLTCRRERAQKAQQLGQCGVGRRPAAQEERLYRRAVVLFVQLAQQRVDVRPVQVVAAGGGDEIAVTTAMSADRQVDVQMRSPARHAVTRFGRATSSPPVRADWGHRFSAQDRQNVQLPSR